MSLVEFGWGLKGVEQLRESCAVLIIVDVLSFSTAVDVATSRGACVFPFALGDPALAQAEAERLDAIVALPRNAAGGQVSLSPASLMQLNPQTRLLLPSPNGSRLTLECGNATVFAGCLRNFTAVAAAARKAAAGRSIGVIAAGERWPDGSLRPALEDEIGSGAIIATLNLPMSAEAEAAACLFAALGSRISTLIRASQSGLELISRDFAEDVSIAVALAASETAPRLVDGAYRAM